MSTVDLPTADKPDLRLVLANVKFSPNLGDGIIAECLETVLRGAIPGLTIRSLDLAGRTAFDADNGRHRQAILKILDRLPQPLRKLAISFALGVLGRFRLTPLWNEMLDPADVVVIGGGALLADADGNFPSKLTRLVRLCADKRIPVILTHVGVTSNWSERSRKNFISAVRRADWRWTSTRDPQSAENLVAEFGCAMPRPSVALDPGLLSCEVYGRSAHSDRTSEGLKAIGLSVTHPSVLQLHGDRKVDRAAYREWLVEAAAELSRLGELRLFTNGSPEDEAFLDEVVEDCRRKPIRFDRIDRPTNPSELVHTIAQLDLVVASRLHACIAAYSYAIPQIGLSWDRKVDNFFALTGRSEWIVDWRNTVPHRLGELAGEAFRQPIDVERHSELLSKCRAGISELAAQIIDARACG